jgi:hypothetical protein
VRLELQALEDRQLFSVSVANYGYGLEVFAIGKQDAQVYAQKQDAHGHPVGNAFLTAPGAVKTISTINCHSGIPTVFAIGLDDQVYEQQFDVNGNSLGGWRLAAPGRVKTINPTPWGVIPELFVIGMDDQVYALKLDMWGNAQGGYFLTNIGQVKAISVGTCATYNFPNFVSASAEVFAIGLDNQVYAQKLDGNGRSVTPYFLTRPGAVKTLTAVVYFGDPGVYFGTEVFDSYVFVIGLDNQVYSQKFDYFGNSATGYVLTCYGQVNALAVNSDMKVFVIGLDSQVYVQRGNRYLYMGDVHGGQPRGFKAISVPNSPGSQAVFATGPDDRVYGHNVDAGGFPIGDYYLTLDQQVM